MMKPVRRRWSRVLHYVSTILFVLGLLVPTVGIAVGLQEFWEHRWPILITLGVCVGLGVIVCLCIEALRYGLGPREAQPEPRGFEVITHEG